MKVKELRVENKMTKQDKIKTLKNRYEPLYGLKILHLLAVEDGYNFCCFASKSIPRQGSETVKMEHIKQLIDHEVKKVIIHKDYRITVFTDKGNIQYLKL
jgi:hypothetical protein